LIKSLPENKKIWSKAIAWMFPNKNWSFDGLKVLIKKSTTQVLFMPYWVVVDLALSAQYLCCQFFLISAFSLSRLQFLLGNSLSNRFAPHFLFSRKI